MNLLNVINGCMSSQSTNDQNTLFSSKRLICSHTLAFFIELINAYILHSYLEILRGVKSKPMVYTNFFCSQRCMLCHIHKS